MRVREHQRRERCGNHVDSRRFCLLYRRRALEDGDFKHVDGVVLEQPASRGVTVRRWASCRSGRHQSCLQSEGLCDDMGKSADVTRTVNQATAPNNTVTADALVFNDAAVSESAVFQGITRTAGAWVDSVYVKGNGQSGTIDLVQFNSSVNLFSAACAYNSTTWTRCSVGPNTLSALSWFFIIGCEKQGHDVELHVVSLPSTCGARKLRPETHSTPRTSRAMSRRPLRLRRGWPTPRGLTGATCRAHHSVSRPTLTPAWVIGEQLSVTGVLEGRWAARRGAGFFYVASGQRLQTLNSGSANITTALAPAFARYVTH